MGMIQTIEEALSLTVAYSTPSRMYVKEKGKEPEFIVNAGTSTAPPMCVMWKPAADLAYVDAYVFQGPVSLKEWKSNPHLKYKLGGRFYRNGACFLEYVNGRLVEYGLTDNNKYQDVNCYPRRPPDYRYRETLPKQCFAWIDIQTRTAHKLSSGYDISITNETAELIDPAIQAIGGHICDYFHGFGGKEFHKEVCLGHILYWAGIIKKANFATEMIPHLAGLAQHVDEWGYMVDTPRDREKRSTNLSLSRVGNTLVFVRWTRCNNGYYTYQRAWMIDLEERTYSSFYFNRRLNEFRRTFDNWSSTLTDEIRYSNGSNTIRVIGDNVLDGTGIDQVVEKLPENLVFDEHGDKKCSVREMRECNEIPLHSIDMIFHHYTGRTIEKMGLNGIIASELIRGRNYVKESLGIDLINDIEEDPKSLCKIMGLSPRQVKTIDARALEKDARLPRVAFLKPYMSGMSQFDDATFASLCRFDTDMSFWDGLSPWVMRQFFENRNLASLPPRRVADVFAKYCDPQQLDAFVEYSRLLEEVKLTPHYDAHEYPTFPKDAVERLNSMRLVHARYKAEIDDAKNRDKTEKFQKAVEPWLYLDYVNDKYPYMMRVVRKPGELVVEGTALHHCVGGFDWTIINGNEVIVFLRRLESPDTSWYTVDVTRDKVVRQIHGVCNSLLYRDPEYENILAFIREWIKEKGLNDNLSGINSVLCAIR